MDSTPPLSSNGKLDTKLRDLIDSTLKLERRKWPIQTCMLKVLAVIVVVVVLILLNGNIMDAYRVRFSIATSRGETRCIMAFRNDTDGFGSTMQQLYPALIYGLAHGIETCFVKPARMEHVTREEIGPLFEQLGITYHQPEDCVRCTVRKRYFSYAWQDLTVETEKKLQSMYVPPPLDPGRGYRRFVPGYTNVAIHVRVRNAEDMRDQGTYNPLLKRIMRQILTEHERVKFFIFSEEAPAKPYRELQAEFPDVEVILDGTTLETFSSFVMADVLVMAPSALSYIAAILNPNQVYYVDYNLPPRPRYIILK